MTFLVKMNLLTMNIVVAGVRHGVQAVQPPVRGAPAAGVPLRVLRRDVQEHEAAAGPQAGVAHRAVRGQQEGQPAAADPRLRRLPLRQSGRTLSSDLNTNISLKIVYI